MPGWQGAETAQLATRAGTPQGDIVDPHNFELVANSAYALAGRMDAHFVDASIRRLFFVSGGLGSIHGIGLDDPPALPALRCQLLSALAALFQNELQSLEPCLIH